MIRYKRRPRPTAVATVFRRSAAIQAQSDFINPSVLSASSGVLKFVTKRRNAGFSPRCPRSDAMLRFRRRKSIAGRRAHSFVHEPLEAPAVEVFADVDIAFAVDREGMRYVQRSAEDTLLTDVVDHLERVPQENPDVVVRPVDHVQEALIWREREAGGRPGEQGSRSDESFPHKRAVLLENLNAVVDAVGDIHQPVF